MWRHHRLDHDSETKRFTMSVIGKYRRDVVLRHFSRAVVQGNTTVGTIMNTKR